MKVWQKISELRDGLREVRQKGRKIVLVPTMGALHEGHISLLEIARAHGDFVVTSIFVNPTQFNQAEDYEKYAKDLGRDVAALDAVGGDVVFAPTAPEIYQKGFGTWVSPTPLAELWEGASRPGHFRGVTTVVSMLFNIVNPVAAVFGEKDFQQLRLIEQMVRDLHIPIEIVRAPIVREPDGLAMSSRNVRLSEDARERSTVISKSLQDAKDLISKGESRVDVLCDEVKTQILSAQGFTIDYVAIINEETLEPVSSLEENSRMIVAAIIDEVRLLDNAALKKRR